MLTRPMLGTYVRFGTRRVAGNACRVQDGLRARVGSRGALHQSSRYIRVRMTTVKPTISASPGSKRRSDGDIVDVAFNRETECAQLRQPRVAILIVNEGEDADHPGSEVASDARPAALVTPVDDVSSTVHSRIHVSCITEAGSRDANLDLPCHVGRKWHAV
jgi:hypothetical protein